jgi:hypothetical protein
MRPLIRHIVTASVLATVMGVTHAQRNFMTEGSAFANPDVLRNFQFEGIDLNTPVAEVGRILEARGYRPALDPRPPAQRSEATWVRGDLVEYPQQRNVAGYSSKPGGLAYRVVIDWVAEVDEGRILMLRFERLGEAVRRGAQPSRTVLPKSDDVATATALKQLVCANLTDIAERKVRCRPNSDTRIEIADLMTVPVPGGVLQARIDVAPNFGRLELVNQPRR